MKFCAIALLVALGLYVLSMGPVVGFLGNKPLSPRQAQVLFTFYAPVTWLHNSTPLEKPLEVYQEWWWQVINERGPSNALSN
jgi:hypothetical protein